MDCDPRITSDGNGYGAAHGVHCNFHYGYVHDVFDEHAKNEEAVVQALHHVIAKADTDINDLKDELAILQIQQKWDESDVHKNFFDVCCATFKQKIDSLTSTIQRLKNDAGTVSEIQKPAERISDIVDALIKRDFEVLDKQEGDLNKEQTLVVSSVSLTIDRDVRQQASNLESSMKSDKQTAVLEKKPTQSLSEESFADATRYTTKNLTAVRSTKPTAPQCAGTENNMDGFKSGESRYPVLVANTETMIKVEQDGHDTDIQHNSTDIQHDKDSSQDPLDALELEAQTIPDLEITYGRRKTGLANILKPLGKEVKKNLDGDTPFSPSHTLKPQKKIVKKKSYAIAQKIGKKDSPSSEIERTFHLPPESNQLVKLEAEENTATENPVLDSQAKKCQPEGTKRDILSILSAEVKVPEGSLKLRSPPMEVKDKAITSLASTRTPKSNSSIVELPFVDLESLKKTLSEEPNFLKTLAARQLRETVKLLQIRGTSKMKKEKLIEEVSKHLAT